MKSKVLKHVPCPILLLLLLLLLPWEWGCHWKREISTQWHAGCFFFYIFYFFTYDLTSPSFLNWGDSYLLGRLLVITNLASWPFACLPKRCFPWKPLIYICFPLKPSERQSRMDKNSPWSCREWGWQPATHGGTWPIQRLQSQPCNFWANPCNSSQESVWNKPSHGETCRNPRLLASPSETTNAQNLGDCTGWSGLPHK